MATWKVGDVLPALSMCRQLINAEISPLAVSVDSQDITDDLIKYKTRALSTHVLNVMPKFMLKTPGMRRRAKTIEVLLDRVQSVHTPAQRAGCPRDLADDLLSLHTSDPQFLPESNLRFALSAPLIASAYLGDALSFALYAMASQPELYARIQQEADALFDGGDPAREDFTEDSIDVTRRFIMESMRVYPIVPMSVRNVMNACVVEDYEIPEGSRIFIAQAASHYMDDVFPTPAHSISTAICPSATNISVRATLRSGWARTRVSATGGWSCNWPSTCCCWRTTSRSRCHPRTTSSRSIRSRRSLRRS